MTTTEPRHPDATRRGMGAAWRRNGFVWLGLMVLLACTATAASLPLGEWTLTANLAVAAVQALLVAILSMGLGRATSLDRVAAASGFLFILVLFVFLFSDVFTRL